MDKILWMLKALQTADKEVALLANWPQNELLENGIVLPSSTTRKEALKRKEKP